MPASRRASMPGGDGQQCHAIERGQAIGGNAEFAFQIEGAAAAGQLDDVGHIVDGFERRFAVLALHQAGDVLVEHGVAEARGNRHR